MYKLKEKPEDFYVEEIPDFELVEKGKYSLFILEKKNWNTYDVIKKLSKILRINEKYFNIAGIKDKNAVTKQYFSVHNLDPKRLKNIKIKDVEIKFIGFIRERLRLGQLKGNNFKIVVRNVDKKVEKIDFIENYFDEQRFGSENVDNGLKILKGNFERKLSNRMLRFYIGSYQSYLFNQVLSKYLGDKGFKVKYSKGEFRFLDKKIKNFKMPIVGYNTVFDNDEIRNFYFEFMKKDNVKISDFRILGSKEISSKGDLRDIIVELKDLKVKYEDCKGILEFSLPPGSYATLVVKKMFGKFYKS
ncbi:tRNA pseudouridine(13) synthase TruD [archaeon]|nr:tRNA pseudouridine(13) synthase TruD [archaeon]